jgi:hypothetical protein
VLRRLSVGRYTANQSRSEHASNTHAFIAPLAPGATCRARPRSLYLTKPRCLDFERLLLRGETEYVNTLSLSETLEQHLAVVGKLNRVPMPVSLGAKLRECHFFVSADSQLLLQTFGDVVKKKTSPRRNAHRAGNRWRAECQQKSESSAASQQV